jgi:enamine deaminase RidA (YjgF/YER057c/UK114 family)
MPIEHLNPDSLVKNPAFTQAVAVSGAHTVIYVGGQDAVDVNTRQVVGKGDLRAQTQQVFANLQAALQAAGAGLEHIVKWNIYLVAGHDPRPALEVFQTTGDIAPTHPQSRCWSSPASRIRIF